MESKCSEIMCQNPALDDFFYKKSSFSNCVSPTCAPTRASLLTGIMAIVLGLHTIGSVSIFEDEVSG